MIQNALQKTGITSPSLSELYTDIELTEEEKNEAIEKALFELRYQKQAERNARAYREKITAPVPVIRYTSDQLKQALRNQPEFDIDGDNERVVDLLCHYFSEDPRFEEQKDVDGKPYSLKKGILLFGAVGVGKTQLLEIFRNNQKQSYQVVTCHDVEGTYAKNGPDFHPQTGAPGLRKYFGLVSLQTMNQYGHDTLGFFFDDLGQEVTHTKFFGTERNVMEEVLIQRYKNGLFTSTHVTTNLNREMLKETYGIRVADRIREMFNFIAFPPNAKSRRK